MKISVLNGFGLNLKTIKDWAIVFTLLTPLALLGRAVADWTLSTAAALFLFHCIAHREWGWVKAPWVVMALLLWGYSVLRAAFIPQDGFALFSAVVWLRYIIFAVCLAEGTLKNDKARLWLLYAMTAAVGILSVDGLIQFVFGQDLLGNEIWGDSKFRLTGVYQRPILGITIANLFAVPVFWLLARQKVLQSTALALLGFAVVFLSGDRMALILISLLLAVWLFFLMRKGSKRLFLLGLLAPVVFVGSFAVFSPRHFERQIVSTVETIATLGSSPYGLVWKSALNVGADNPVFGVGIRQFRKACRDTRFGPVKTPERISRCYTHPHNAYLEWFSEGGLVGLFLFVCFVGTIGSELVRRLKIKSSDPVLWGLAAVLGGRLFPLFISANFFINWSAIPFWIALGWAMSYPRRKSNVLSAVRATKT